MKTKFWIVILLMSALRPHAQTLSPVEMNTAGSVQKANVYTLSYSMGGTAVTTLSADNAMVTQGFQQPEYYIITHVQPINKLQVTVNAFPNPADKYINVRLTNLEQPVVCRVDIMSSSGNRYPLSVNYYELNGNNSVQLDLSQLLPGFYVVSLINKNGNHTIASFMMVKIK